MRWRPILILSLVANFLLAAGWFFSARHQTILYRRATQNPPVAPAAVKTNLVIRRQFFSWQEIESSDYRTFITNLRGIDCPEQTIRDIIIADVNTLYARARHGPGHRIFVRHHISRGLNTPSPPLFNTWV